MNKPVDIENYPRRRRYASYADTGTFDAETGTPYAETGTSGAEMGTQSGWKPRQ